MKIDKTKRKYVHELFFHSAFRWHWKICAERNKNIQPKKYK